MSCKNDCQVSHSRKAQVEDSDVKCICKSVPFEVTTETEGRTIYENRQGLSNIGLYTVVNNTNDPMRVDFITSFGTTGLQILAGSSVTEQLVNLQRIDVTGVTIQGDEDGRLDFEICFPMVFKGNEIHTEPTAE